MFDINIIKNWTYFSNGNFFYLTGFDNRLNV